MIGYGGDKVLIASKAARRQISTASRQAGGELYEVIDGRHYFEGIEILLVEEDAEGHAVLGYDEPAGCRGRLRAGMALRCVISGRCMTHRCSALGWIGTWALPSATARQRHASTTSRPCRWCCPKRRLLGNAIRLPAPTDLSPFDLEFHP